jgi:hypothetical protein
MLGRRKKCHGRFVAKSRERPNHRSEYAMRAQASAPFCGGKVAASHAWKAVPARAVNLSLRIVWRPAANFAKQGALLCEWWKISDVA